MARYTDRDCYAALIRVAAALNTSDTIEWCVEVPRVGARALSDLRRLASQLDVRLLEWNAEIQNEGTRRLVLDHAPSCYGGGVRVQYCIGKGTGQYTPGWWTPSAGLGPGAVRRPEFLHILGAVEGVLS